MITKILNFFDKRFWNTLIQIILNIVLVFGILISFNSKFLFIEFQVLLISTFLLIIIIIVLACIRGYLIKEVNITNNNNKTLVVNPKDVKKN